MRHRFAPLHGDPTVGQYCIGGWADRRRSLTVGSICHNVALKLGFPTVTVGKELGLVVQQLFVCFGRELEVRTKDNSIDGAGLLAETAVDALGHVNIVTSGSSRTIGTGLSLDSNRKRRADGLTELARDASLFTRGVTAERVLTTEAGRDQTLLERVVQCDLGCEDVFKEEESTSDQLGHEHVATETFKLVIHGVCLPVRGRLGS